MMRLAAPCCRYGAAETVCCASMSRTLITKHHRVVAAVKGVADMMRNPKLLFDIVDWSGSRSCPPAEQSSYLWHDDEVFEPKDPLWTRMGVVLFGLCLGVMLLGLMVVL